METKSLSVVLSRNAYAMLHGAPFSNKFSTTHYAVLVRLAIHLEEKRHLTPLQAAETCFISHRYAREVLGELMTWGLAIKIKSAAGSGYEYALDCDGLDYAHECSKYDPTPTTR